MNNENVQDLQQQSIKASMNKNWDEAIKLNLNILKITPNDIPTLNRQGIAYSMSDKPKKASLTFRKVIKIAPQNQIAINNLARLKANSDKGLANPFLQTVNFIEEPGKSKVIPLISQAEPSVFASLDIGEPIELTVSKHKVKVSKGKTFIGYLPDSISFRLLKLIGAGYKYKAVMKSVNAKKPFVFVQETKTTKRLRGIPSFPLDDKDRLPSLSAGESSHSPRLEIFDPLVDDEG